LATAASQSVSQCATSKLNENINPRLEEKREKAALKVDLKLKY